MKVRAHNSDGWGAFSSENADGTQVRSAPTASPTISSSSATQNSITLNWSDLSTDADKGYSATTKFHIYINDGAGGSTFTLSTTITDGSTSTTISSLNSGSEYSFKISAENIYGEGAQSSSYEDDTTDVPDQPAAITVF